MESKQTKMTNLKKWDTMHCFVMFGAGLMYWFTGWKMLMILAAIPSFFYLFISEWPALRKLRPFAGYANWVTFARLIGTMGVFILSEGMSNEQIAIILVILISLDGLDGFLARRFKQVTDLGANFDMETDSIFVCLTSILLIERGLVGSWILLVGFMRYFYVVFIYMLGMHQLSEKRTRFGPTIAVILFIAVINPFALQRSIYFPCLIVSSVLVSLSFSWSFYLLIIEKRKTKV
jgi:phosphatidylglycerophosphate synthase